MKSSSRRRFRVGLDIGGTFTDLAVHDSDSGNFVQFKSITTPDPIICGSSCLNKAAAHFEVNLRGFLQETELFCFGSTIGLNTLITGTGANVGIITTRGHGDHYRIAEMNRGGVVDIRDAVERTFKPLISRRNVCEVNERVDYTGSVVVPLNEGDVREAIQHLVEKRKIDALVISFLWSQRNDAHEKRVKEIVSELYPNLFITLGSDISGTLGEFKRTSTAVINAYIGAAVKRQGELLNSYLVEQGLGRPLLVMQTLGGVAPLSEVARVPVMLLNSGPAGGIVGALAVSKAIGEPNIVCMDVGGTSCDISAITDYEIELSGGLQALGHPIAVSGVEVVSIGAGGGSIATMERAGDVSRLRVGPESAGSSPGPACYGRGGERPTVTDANLVLGLFDPKRKLGGEIGLSIDSARDAIKRFASLSGADNDAAKDAWGIYRVITSAMADAIENFLVAKGYDPRQYSLAGFGAAAGLHAAAIGDRLGCRKILLPNFFPVFSAFGLMTTDIRHAYSLTDDTVRIAAGTGRDNVSLDRYASYVSERLREVAQLPMRLLEAEDVPPDRRSVQLSIDIRYTGQVLELGASVPSSVLDDNLSGEAFRVVLDDWIEKYKRVYGAGAAWDDGVIELINYRAVGIGKIDPPNMPTVNRVGADSLAKARPKRPIFLGEWLDAEIWDESSVGAGSVISGPALIEGDLRTVLVGRGDRASVDSSGNLLIESGGNWGWR